MAQLRSESKYLEINFLSQTEIEKNRTPNNCQLFRGGRLSSSSGVPLSQGGGGMGPCEDREIL